MKNTHTGSASVRLHAALQCDRLQTGIGLVAALCCVPLTASAQAQQSAALEEIVVTAQRREETIQDVPISISAYGQQQMDIQGVRQVDDIATLAPGVTFNRGGGFGSDLGSSISIRGISSIAGTATTGIYIDDTPVQVRATIASGNFSTNAYPRLFDVERVEVLRGPQGTLFGSGSEGGTVRFITPSPSLTESSVYSRAEVGATEGGEATYEAGLAVGVPLVEDRVGMRASVSYRHDGGWIDRSSYETGQVLDKNANGTNSTVARLAFAFAPTDSLTLTPSIFYQRIENNDASAFWMPSTDPSFNQPLGDIGDGRYESGARVRQFGTQDLTLTSLKIDWNFGAVALVSNTSYYDRSDKGVTDFTNFETPLWTSIFTGTTVTIPENPNWIAPGSDTQTNEFFTQEIRFQSTDEDSRIRWVAGVFYSDQDTVTDRRVQNTWLPEILAPLSQAVPFIPDCTPATCYQSFFGVPAVDGKYIFVGKTTTNDKQIAGFGQIDFRITDHLTATAGVRYAQMDFDFANYADGPVNGPPAPRTDLGGSDDTATTPKFGLNYKTDGGQLFYASAAKGFRPGGANAPLRNPACLPDLAEIGLTAVPETYGPDSIWAYELGTKLSFADTVQMNLSVFRNDWKDIINNFSLDCILSFTTNLGEARSQGADLELTARPTDNLTLTVAVGYTDAEYTETVNGVNLATGAPDPSIILVEDGEPLMGSATSGYAAAQYNFTLLDNSSFVRLDYRYQGPQDLGAGAASTAIADDKTHMINGRFGVKIEDWDLSLFVNNLTNEDPILSAAAVYVTSPLFRGTTFRPRTVGLTAIYRY